jgi:hypothetical protein
MGYSLNQVLEIKQAKALAGQTRGWIQPRALKASLFKDVGRPLGKTCDRDALRWHAARSGSLCHSLSPS